MFIFGRYAMAPEGDEGGSTDSGGQNKQTFDGVPRQKYETLESNYNKLMSEKAEAEEQARLDNAAKEGRQGEELKRIQETNRKLEERLAKSEKRDADEAEKVFESFSDEQKSRFESLRDQLDTRAWLQFVRQEQRLAAANTPDPEEGDDFDGDEKEPGLRPRQSGGKAKQLPYEKEAVIGLEEELGRETTYLPKMQIKRDQYKGSEYTLRKKAWLNGIKGKTDHGESLDHDTARAVLGGNGRERNTREPTKGQGKKSK